MNTNPQTPNGTFRFTAVVQFEIDPDTAARLLVESDPTKTVHQWLLSQQPQDDNPYSGNAGNLRDKLGAYLADKEISKARPLMPGTDPDEIPF